jgi:hypothetical protein
MDNLNIYIIIIIIIIIIITLFSSTVTQFKSCKCLRIFSSASRCYSYQFSPCTFISVYYRNPSVFTLPIYVVFSYLPTYY